MRFRPAFLALLFIGLLNLSPGQASQKPGELAAVLSRAAEYVARYEDQFGSLRMDENYVQNAAVFGRGSRNISRREPVRRIESEFWIFQFENERSEKEQVGIRRVNKVDNYPVKRAETSMEALLSMGTTPAGMRKLIAFLRQESAQYDIGGVERTVNAPTFALRVARGAEAPRFTFDKRGTDKIDGVDAWKVEFHEKQGPTLVHAGGAKNEELNSSGNLWIDPVSGRILKTEFVVKNPYSKPWVVGHVIVTYVENKAVGIYVPKRMNESYETEEGFVECQADYTNVRPFIVESKSSEPVPLPR